MVKIPSTFGSFYINIYFSCSGLLTVFVLASGMAESYALSVDDISVLVAIFVDERLVVLCHAAQRHTHV